MSAHFAANLKSTKLDHLNATNVPLLKHLLDRLAGLNAGLRVTKHLIVQDLLQVNVGDVAGGHDVVVVDLLDERFHLGALFHLGLAHGACHLTRVTVNAGNYINHKLRQQSCSPPKKLVADISTRTNGVAKLAVTTALVKGLDDNRFAASKAAVQEHHNLSILDTTA